MAGQQNVLCAGLASLIEAQRSTARTPRDSFSSVVTVVVVVVVVVGTHMPIHMSRPCVHVCVRLHVCTPARARACAPRFWAGLDGVKTGGCHIVGRAGGTLRPATDQAGVTGGCTALMRRLDVHGLVTGRSQPRFCNPTAWRAALAHHRASSRQAVPTGCF